LSSNYFIQSVTVGANYLKDHEYVEVNNVWLVCAKEEEKTVGTYMMYIMWRMETLTRIACGH